MDDTLVGGRVYPYRRHLNTRDVWPLENVLLKGLLRLSLYLTLCASFSHFYIRQLENITAAF